MQSARFERTRAEELFSLDFASMCDHEMDYLVKGQINWACDYIIRFIGVENVQAIILIGSLANGEGSGYFDVNGGLRLLSDMDFWIVANEQFFGCRNTDFSATKPEAINKALNAAINRERDACLISPIDTAIMRASKARRILNNAVFATLQLGGTPHVIWGDAGIIDNARLIDGGEITDHEILKILLNRISEQVFYSSQFKSGNAAPEDLAYHSAKAVVDSVMAVCAASRHCPPRMVERLEAFRKICKKTPLWNGAEKCADFWTGYKLSSEPERLTRRFGNGDLEIASESGWKESGVFVLNSLKWCARERLGIMETEPEKLAWNLSEYHSNEKAKPFEKKERELIRVITLAGLKMPEPAKMHRLLSKYSPLSLIYGSALLLIAMIGQSEGYKKRLLAAAIDMLPIGEIVSTYSVEKSHDNICRITGRLWNELVMGGRR